MKCPKCYSEISDDAAFCSNCGTKIEKCKQCGNVLMPGANYCSYCGVALHERKSEYQPINTEYQNRLGGYYQPLSDVYKNEHEYNEEHIEFNDIPTHKKVNKRVIIFSVIALIVSTALAGGYLLKTADMNPFVPDGGSINTEVLKLNGGNDPYATIGNINQGGHATIYKDRLYVCDDEGRLVSMSASFDDRKVLTDHKVEYVSIVNDVIYYVNQDMKICSMDLNGNNQCVIVDWAAYYVNVVGDKIYYQSDRDGERLYLYDLKTLEHKELNQRVTYNINVSDDKIYYTSTDGIYCIGKDGQGEEKLSGDKGYSMILRENKLYYSTSSYETKVLDLNTKTSYSLFNERNSFLNMTTDYIFYYTASGVIRYDISTKETKNIYTGDLDFFEVVGNVIIVTDTDGHRMIMDLNGTNQQRLFLTSEQNFV